MLPQQLHYDFKFKADKIDSQKIQELLPAQIDWILNNAYLLYVDSQADKFETSQEAMDAIGELVYISPGKQPYIEPTLVPDTEGVMYEVELSDLAEDYYRLVRTVANIKKGDCVVNAKTLQVRQNDLTDLLNNTFYKPSFDWRELPIVISHKTGDEGKSIYLYSDGTFEIDKVFISFIKQPKKIWIGTYDFYENLKDTTPIYIEGTDAPVGCELSDKSCKEIVDVAVTEFYRMMQQGDLNKLNLEKQILD